MLHCSIAVAAACGAPKHRAPEPTDTEPEGTACAEDTLRLRATRWQGAPTALYVPARLDGEKVLFHLDSASAYTVLFAQGAELAWIEHAGDVTIGCLNLPLPGYAGLGRLPPVDGLPVVGMAGTDLLLRGPTAIDIAGATLTRHAQAPADWSEHASIPYELVHGEMLVDATFDGRPVRLVVDTGAAHAVWLGEPPQPGDVEVVTEDALGDPLSVWQGSATIGLTGSTWTAPMLRAERFAVLEAVEAQIGEPLDGLLGLSSFPGGRLMIDPVGRRLYIPGIAAAP
jgi:hypothetical protein